MWKAHANNTRPPSRLRIVTYRRKPTSHSTLVDIIVLCSVIIIRFCFSHFYSQKPINGNETKGMVALGPRWGAYNNSEKKCWQVQTVPSTSDGIKIWTRKVVVNDVGRCYRTYQFQQVEQSISNDNIVSNERTVISFPFSRLSYLLISLSLSLRFTRSTPSTSSEAVNVIKDTF